MASLKFKARPGIDNESLLVTQSGANAIARTVESKLQDFINVKDFGAVGDGVTDDSAAINAALTYWGAAAARHLHFPSGTYVYGGSSSIELSLGNRRFNKITMSGSIKATTTAAIAWKIYEAENITLQINLAEGGTLGDFSASTPVGGTTFLQVHSIGWGKLIIEAMSYLGRVLHTTAGGTDPLTRCRMLDVDLKTGNRLIFPGYGYCGQPLFADSGNCTQVGAWGKISWRGEGHRYGPTFERLNDIDIKSFEAGKFTTQGLEFRGCVNVYADTIFLGEADAAVSALLTFKNTAAARQCSQVYLSKVSMLTANIGLRCENFDTASPGLQIDQFQCEFCDIGLDISAMSTVGVRDISTKNAVNLVRKSGTCGDIKLNVSSIGTVTGDAIVISNSHDSFSISGSLRGGASGYSLIKLNNNQPLELNNLHMESDVCTQLLDITFADSTSIRHVGGSVAGSSPVYTGIRRPELVKDVKSLQTESFGSAVIASGTSSVLVNTGLDLGLQVANAAGVAGNGETSAIWLAEISGSYVNFAVPSSVTANREIYWSASAVLVRNDTNA